MATESAHVRVPHRRDLVHVHSDEAREQYEAIGLERWQGYLLGRAGTLGVPPAGLVIATIGAFAPDLQRDTYETALATASVPDALAAKEAGAKRAPTEHGRALRDDIEDATETALDPVTEGIGHALDSVVERATAWSRAITDGGAFPDDAHKRAAG